MIKRILLWLVSIYFKPATIETKTPEVETMSEPQVDAQAGQADQIAGIDGVMNIANVATGSASPAAEVKAGVADFEAALSFVESGVAQLGEAAKDELKALAKKYL